MGMAGRRAFRAAQPSLPDQAGRLGSWPASRGQARASSVGADTGKGASLGYWLVALVLLLLPLECWTLPYGIRVSDFALVLVSLYGLLGVRSAGWRWRLPLLAPMWLITLSSLAATLFGTAVAESVMAIVQEVYLFACFIALLNVLGWLSEGQRDGLMKIWALVAVLEATCTVMGMLGIGPAFFSTWVGSGAVRPLGGYYRAVGTFVNPNAAAAFLAASLFVVLATSWPAWLRLPLAMWLLVGTYATGSMGGVLSGVASFAVLVALLFALTSRQAAGLTAGALAIGAGVVTAIAAAIVLQPWALSGSEAIMRGGLFAVTVGRLPHSLGSRIALIAHAWPAFIAHPWGTGPNTSALDLGSLHNDYLAMLFERGPVGAIGWLWLVAATLMQSLRAAALQVESSRRRAMLSLGAGFLACAVNALAHEVSHFRQVWVLMAFVFATSYALPARATVDGPRARERRYWRSERPPAVEERT